MTVKYTVEVFYTGYDTEGLCPAMLLRKAVENTLPLARGTVIEFCENVGNENVIKIAITKIDAKEV
jgi:hypothetical protein